MPFLVETSKKCFLKVSGRSLDRPATFFSWFSSYGFTYAGSWMYTYLVLNNNFQLGGLIVDAYYIGRSVGGSVGGWVGGWVGVWVGGWVGGWVDGSVGRSQSCPRVSFL